MQVFEKYLKNIENPEHRARTREVLSWVMKSFPNLVPQIAWNQPMFTDHGTFIIGFSTSKFHLAAAPERAGICQFSNEIQEAGFQHSKQLIRFKWNLPVNYGLLKQIIEFNIRDKADCQTFWRKRD